MANEPSKPAVNEPVRVALHARNTHFDFANLALHWIPDQPIPTHMINVMHTMLPQFEEWFVKVFGEALPLIKDDQLREDVVGFIGQEAQHAKGHQSAMDKLNEQGLDLEKFVKQMSWLIEQIYSDRGLTGSSRLKLLSFQLSLTAAIEHITAFLGQWVLNADALDAAGADPVMLDLLRWHGAEEVEHRAVAFDLYQHIDGSYIRRVVPYAVVAPMIVWLWMIVGTRHLLRNDPTTTEQLTPLSYLKAAGKGLLPTVGQLLAVVPGYLRPDYNPSSYGNTSQAVAYLASSPAAQAADKQGH